MILNIISRTWTFRHRNEITSVQAHSIGFSDLTSKFTNHQFEKAWGDRKLSFIWSHNRGIHHMSQTQPILNNIHRGMKCWAQWPQGFILWAKLNHSWTTIIGGWSAELNGHRDSSYEPNSIIPEQHLSGDEVLSSIFPGIPSYESNSLNLEQHLSGNESLRFQAFNGLVMCETTPTDPGRHTLGDEDLLSWRSKGFVWRAEIQIYLYIAPRRMLLKYTRRTVFDPDSHV